MNKKDIAIYVAGKDELISFCEERITYWKSKGVMVLANTLELEKNKLMEQRHKALLTLKGDIKATTLQTEFAADGIIEKK